MFFVELLKASVWPLHAELSLTDLRLTHAICEY